MATGGQVQLQRQSFGTAFMESLEDLPEEEMRETKRALYEYVFCRAEKDQLLTRDEAESFHEARLNNAKEESSESVDGDSQAQMVGRRIAELGDEIDSMFGDQFDDILQLYNDNPDQAFNTFSTVLQQVFEWDTETGLPKFNIGRIAAVLGYCYHLCKKYISQYFNSYGLLSFLGVIAGFLIQFFIKQKFYDWLKGIGGWGQLVQFPAASVVSRIVSAPNFFLIVGVASLAIYAFQYFRGR